jgi:predicted metal-dependent hydrolase
MTDLTVRKLLIDLTTPFAHRWNGGDAFRSAFFNALSMSFPIGEQYFIDSVRTGLKTLPDSEREKWTKEIQGFVGQEATHRRIHGLFNGHLEKQGFTNELERRAALRMKQNAHRDARVHVGATAATEHLTAIFADWMLNHPAALEGAEPRLQTLWLWHSAEESEHRSTAFDLYKAMKGNEEWRIKLFRYITITFLVRCSAPDRAQSLA